MIPAARQNQIISWLEQEGYIATADLVDRLQVSQMTVWRDLQELERDGRLRRVYGGAEYKQQDDGEAEHIPVDPRSLPEISFPDTFKIKRKIAIGQHTARHLIQDQQALILEGGSTVANLIPHIKAQGITALTNGLYTLMLCQSLGTIPNVLCCGGVLNQDTQTFIGPRAEAFFRNYRVDTVFISAYGYIPGEGFFDPTPLYDSMKRTICSRAKQTIMLLESVKLNRRAFTHVLHEHEVDLLVIDGEAHPDDLKAIREQGVEIQIADTGL